MRETQFLFVRIEEQRPYEYFFMFLMGFVMCHRGRSTQSHTAVKIIISWAIIEINIQKEEI